LIWPPLDGVSNILCVIVPGGEDGSAYPGIPGVHEAASKVVVVDKDGLAVREMETICKLYEAKGTPRDLREIRKGVASHQPTVRNFALKTAIVNLGRVAPEEAMNIFQHEAMHYEDRAKHRDIAYDPFQEHARELYEQHVERADIDEADEIIRFIKCRIKFGPLEPQDRMDNKFLRRCLGVLAQSPSKVVRGKAEGNAKDKDVNRSGGL